MPENFKKERFSEKFTNLKDIKQNGKDAARRARGHVRGTRSNGFASAPPFPKRLPIEPYQRDIDEREKKQRIQLIEKELNVLAMESQCGIGKWR